MKLVNCTACLSSKEIYLERFSYISITYKKEGRTRRSELQEMKWVLQHDFAAIHKARFI
jgi:hypothetical protein